MHKLFEYSAWVGSAWLTSNVMFVIVWCWLHSNDRPWMNDQERDLTVFAIPGNEVDQNDAMPFFPENLLGTLDPNALTLDKAS
jgi:hypothetical protein